jgi:imidazolonepropionase-like amidohydrolase
MSALSFFHTCRWFAVVLILAAVSATTAGAQQSVRHDFLTIGEKSGEQVLSRNADGSTTISFNFNDRGRGPQTTTRYVLDERGLPVEIEISGLNYSKSEISESFSRRGEKASWTSANEQGSSTRASQSFFWPVNGPPEFNALLARALLQDEDGEIPLLPSGSARIDTLSQKTVSSKAGVATEITLYAIAGLGDAPTFIWLDASGNLFGADYGWFAVAPQGFGSSYTLMKLVQEEVETASLITASARLKTSLDGLTAFTSVDLFDSLNGTLQKRKTVYVMDGLISSVVDADVPVSEGALVVDGTGKTMIPGLWDMHGHVSASNYFNYLALGITNVRDMANDPEFIVNTRRAIDAGRLIGPDIYALGFIDKNSEYAAPTGMLAETLAEAIDFVDYYARRGFVGIKLYSSIDPAWVAPIAKHAHSLGLSVQGHVPAYMEATQAINDGYDEITHINMAMLDLLDAKEVDTRTPLRFTVPGSRGGSIDVNGPAMDKLVALMKARGTAIDPTLGIFLDMFLNEPGQVLSSHRRSADHYPAGIRRAVLAARGRNFGDEENYARAAATASAMVKRFHEEGITVLAGTDNSPWGFALVFELRAYVEAGIPEADVLRLATIGAARHMHVDQALGSITPGKRAHFVLLNGNPLEDIGALLRTHIVVKDSSMFVAADLLREQGYTPFN